MEIPVAIGIDWNMIDTFLDYDIEEGDEINFLCENRQDGNLFSDGPVFNFNGKRIPSYIMFVLDCVQRSIQKSNSSPIIFLHSSRI